MAEGSAARFRDERLALAAKLRVLPGLGHTPMWDDPDLIAALIADSPPRTEQRTPC